jgi:hypothetical protein
MTPKDKNNITERKFWGAVLHLPASVYIHIQRLTPDFVSIKLLEGSNENQSKKLKITDLCFY